MAPAERAGGGDSGGGLVEGSSRALAALVRRAADGGEGKGGLALDANLPEFGGGRCLVRADPQRPRECVLVLGLGSSGGASGAPPGPEALALAVRVLDAVSPGAAQSETPPPEGTGAALRLLLHQVPPTLLEPYSAAASRVPSLVASWPLRAHFERLGRGDGEEGPSERISLGGGRNVFVKPGGTDAITLVYPMHYSDGGTAVLARNFLQKFAEGQRESGGALAKAPTCKYFPADTVPHEIQSQDPAFAHVGNGGYMSFTVNRRHVEGGSRLETAVWNFFSFPIIISAQLKSAQSHFHSRMRKQAAEWQEALEKAGTALGGA